MRQKNVLMICTDHWPATLMGCAGKKNIMTPTLDTLAENGVLFNNFYSECPVCIPARRSMMTGLTPRTHGDRVYSEQMKMPPVKTLAQVFSDSGYQTFGVGKLHVYPQRNRIGFHDVILAEEGRYEFGVVDDYQIWLGEHGYVGQEFMHCMGNNTYYTRPWHLPEEAHPTNWVTNQMMHQIKRKDPTRPAFYYVSYQFPHPPLVPLQSYLDMYSLDEMDEPICGDWVDDSFIMQAMCEPRRIYTEKEMLLAKRAFYAQCTHIDHQIRLLIGTLRECNLLDDTLIIFLSDHGDMLFDHKMVAKRSFYEGASRVPFILSGKPMEEWRGKQENKLGCMADIMPTILQICGLEIPGSVEGVSLMAGASRELLYGEVSEGNKATRMAHDGKHKLIYYPYGNVFQLFDLEKDPQELHNCADEPDYSKIRDRLETYLISQLYGDDVNWAVDGKLVGCPAPDFVRKPDYGFYNQRGYHWPTPANYQNVGKNA